MNVRGAAQLPLLPSLLALLATLVVVAAVLPSWVSPLAGLAGSGVLGALAFRQSGRIDRLVAEATRQTAALGTLSGLLDEERIARLKAEGDAQASRRTIDAAVCGIASLDASGRYVTVNPAFARIEGKTARELIGQEWSSSVAPENLEPMRAAYAKLRQNGKVEIEMNTVRRDGSTFVEELVLVASRDDAGRFLGHHAFVNDVSGRVGVASALSAARDAAVGAAGIKTDFLANMSHEIRTPMNGVVGMLELLRGTSLDGEQAEYIDVAMVSIRSLLRIVNDILDFSKMESGKLDLEQAPFDLRRMMESVSESVAPRASAKGLEVVLEYPSTLSRHFIGDQGRLSQVVTNLVENALKFTSRGRIVLTAEQRADRPSTSTVTYLALSVKDTGIGIPAHRRHEMFEKFTQADASTTRVYGGTGLGLAISKELLSLMGGSLEVLSELGTGSTFIAKLKLLRNPHPPPPEPGYPELAGVRLLVIDDDVVARAVLCETLAGHQLRPSSAPSGAEGLLSLTAAVAANDPFAVVLIDQAMPLADGVAVARTIRVNPLFAKSRLVLLAVLDGTQIEGPEGESLFAARVTKPVRAERLMEALDQVLGGAAPSRPAAPAPVASPGARSPCRVLAVEDNEINAMLLRISLEKLGCTVEPADTGLKAVESAGRTAYDLIIMDCQLPGMDGYEATRRIRANEVGGARVPIVALTAHAMHGDRERCLAAGMDDYLTKPLLQKDVATLVERWGRKGSAR